MAPALVPQPFGANGAAQSTAAADGAASGAPSTPALPPLMLSGFVVARADLVVVLRAWLPTLTDLEALPDGRFLLRCAPSGEPSS